MRTLKINVFNATPQFGSEKTMFNLTSNYTATSGCSSIKHLAECTKGCIKSFTEQSSDKEVAIEIDCVPVNDIEKGPNTNFVLCSKLSDEQKKEFWEHLIAE